MEVKIDTAAIQDIITKAIFDGLNEEQRRGVLVQAVTELLTKPHPGNGYGSSARPSPLQEAFNGAAYRVAIDIANKQLAEDVNFRTQVKMLLDDVANRLFATKIREQLVEAISAAVIKGMSKDY